jgi:hypothetical protein
MSYTAIIYSPEFEKASGLPFGVKGDRIFYYQIERPKPQKGEKEKVELESIVLKKGTNFIDAEAWQAVSIHPSNESELTRLVRLRAITIYTPDNPESCGKDTTDFAEESTVQELVENSKDLEWLGLCLNVDRRLNVRKLISERIKDLNEEIASQRQRVAASSFS